MLYQLNLNDSYLGLILVYTVYILPIGFFLMFNSFTSIPKSLREVAILNGSSEIKILFTIMIPLIIPGIITLIIFSIYMEEKFLRIHFFLARTQLKAFLAQYQHLVLLLELMDIFFDPSTFVAISHYLFPQYT